MSRRGKLCLVPVLLLLAACTAASEDPGSVTTVATPTTVPPSTTISTPDLDTSPLVWLQPLPPLPDPSLPFGDGSEDFYELFTDGAPWLQAAERTQVFGIYSTFVRHYASDEQLLAVIEGVEARGMALAMEMGPLTVPPPGQCVAAEGYGGSDDLDLVRRILDLGGHLDIVALDEPYAFGHKADGPDDCQFSIEEVAEDVARFVTELRRLVPDLIVGDIEPMWAQPEIGADDMAAWLDAYRAASGENFAFIHLDADWRRPDWPETLLETERVARDRGVPVGIIYFGGDQATSDGEWTTLAREHMVIYEEVWGGQPDHVVIQSWNDYPHHALPETDPATLTGLIDHYFSERTTLRLVEGGGAAGTTVDGELLTSGGDPVAGSAVAVGAIPLEGQPVSVAVAGTVPEGADHAVVIIRANAEGSGRGQADIRLYQVGYTEGQANLVPNPTFERGLDSWYGYGDGAVAAEQSDVGAGMMLHLTAGASDSLFVDSTGFSVTPGNPFTLSYSAGVPVGSDGVAYIAVAFLDETELSRSISVFTPGIVDWGEIDTDPSGRFSVGDADMQPGRYRVRASYAGDAGHWGSLTELEVTIG